MTQSQGLFVFAALLLQALLILALLITRAGKRQAEIECERLAGLAETENKRLNDLITNVPGIVWETRIDPISHHHAITFVSRQAEEMLGYSIKDWLSNPDFCLQLVHEADRERVRRELEEVLSQTKQGILHFRWVAKDDRTVWVKTQLAPIFDDSGTIVGSRGVTVDVTEQQLAEKARRRTVENNRTILEALGRKDAQSLDQLRESEERFRSMADNAPVMIWVVDSDRRCTYVNKRWLDFTGRTVDEELGERWMEVIHPEDYEACLESYAGSFEKRQPVELEYRVRRHDGEYRWVYDTGIPRFSSDGTFLGYIGSALDITERKEAEVALQTAHEELHQLKNQLEAENISLQQELQLDENFGEIVGQSDAIKYVLFKITQVAPTDSTVLITGETGTGKELAARAIHGASSRKDRPLIKVNCGALSPTLIESELFGHEKGAFTGAAGRKQGRFELANGGTIFLDEIGELPPESQVKLLRVIQENEFERLGGSKTIKVDVRIVAATNRNLKLEVEQGRFREDLWYRLNVYPVTMPPLRQRKEDISLLVEHFVHVYARKFGKAISSVAPRTMQILQAHSWPGNIRELANVIERAVIHTQGSVLQLVDDFKRVDDESSNKTLEEVEREYIIRTLEKTGWRIEGPYGAAKILGLNPSTLRTRMLKLGIQRRQGIVQSDYLRAT
ncbi:MAG TPA: sigma 54-interacting transcriptional regulator [Pyrinomonadaceae bacterium]|nr:sigma 54-interacting transcriptional regulator [Pyrinomonadaceae bacterium]